MLTRKDRVDSLDKVSGIETLVRFAGFGRGNEMSEFVGDVAEDTLARNGIPFPWGRALTHRQVAREVAISTRHDPEAVIFTSGCFLHIAATSQQPDESVPTGQSSGPGPSFIGLLTQLLRWSQGDHLLTLSSG